MKPLPAATLALASAIFFALSTTPAQGQPSARTVIPGTAPLPADDSLYRELGGRDAIQHFTDDFYERMLLDARIAHFFEGINTRHLKRVLADYFCVVAGGPCVYDGIDMKSSHAHLGIGKGDFNALVEHLQSAMNDANVPFATQNRLLARLAFMHRDIVTR